MAGINKVILVGRLGKDPEVKSFSNGGKIATFSVATSDQWRDKTSGERKEKVEWSTVVIQTEGLVGVAEKYLQKGSEVAIVGKLQTRKWQDSSGADRYTTEIVVGMGGELALIGGGKQGGGNTGDDTIAALKKGFPGAGLPDDDDLVPF